MRPARFTFLRGLLGAAAALLLGMPATAQPAEGPLRIVVGYPAGATSDSLARVIAEAMGRRLKQTVIVENKAGAGGRIGNELVKAAAADGNTLLMTPVATMSIFPHSYAGELRYDPFKDFAPVAHLANFQLGLGVSAAVPARTLAEFVALAKADPGKYGFYASAASGSLPHFFGVMFAREAGIELTHVPYKGTAPAMQALASGEVVAASTVAADIRAVVQAGKARLLAVAGEQRDATFPDVPTFRELGYRNLVALPWYGLFAPAGTPKATLDRLTQAAVDAVKDPAVNKRLVEMGLEPTGHGADRLAQVMKDDHDRWGPIIRASGFKPGAMNVLFIMADQLRWDHLGCAGHPYLKTPNVDALAARGVRFANAFVNSGVCGPSRMSYYTGRYPISHGATWNRVPLSVGEVTLGEMLRGAGLTLALAGKTHVLPDTAGLARLQLEGGSELATLLERGGFTEIDRYDGHHPPGDESGYPAFLRDMGYDSADPWTDYVIAGVGADGQVQSGWHMRNVHLPARVKEEHSETAYMTDQAIRFVREQGSRPWVLHLSYVKPHWPYMAPAPYHAMYSPDQCLPVVRSPAELQGAHPVVAAYRQQEECVSFQRDDCIRTVRPAYQGLISQLDHHLGRLFDTLADGGRLDDTLIVFTADHGDFLGDHWLGEKELFYDTVQKVPFIVADPRRAADATRGSVEQRFVESVDVAPTVLHTLGLPLPAHRLEGRSLLPLLHGENPADWRDSSYSELDYSYREARLLLGKGVHDCRAFSLRDGRWRYVYWLGEREQLFDLQADPEQFNDLGAEVSSAAVREVMRTRLLDFLARRRHRSTVTDEQVARATANHKRAGVFFGQW